jgi:hypothetical protein
LISKQANGKRFEIKLRTVGSLRSNFIHRGRICNNTGTDNVWIGPKRMRAGTAQASGPDDLFILISVITSLMRRNAHVIARSEATQQSASPQL